MNETVTKLLQRLLCETEELKHAVLNHDDGDSWIAILDLRQKTMDEISQLIQQGHVLSEKDISTFIIPSFEIHNELLPIMKAKLSEVSSKLTTARRTREIMPTYGDIDFNGYGVFFDKKK